MPVLQNDRQINLRDYVNDKILERLDIYCNKEFEEIFAQLAQVQEEDFDSDIQRFLGFHDNSEVEFSFSFGGIKRYEKVRINLANQIASQIELVDGEDGIREAVKDYLESKDVDNAYGIVDDDSDNLEENSEDEIYADSDNEWDRESLSEQDMQCEMIDSAQDYQEDLDIRAEKYVEALKEFIESEDVKEIREELEYIQADISEKIKELLCKYLLALETADGQQRFSQKIIDEFERLILNDIVFADIEEYEIAGWLEAIKEKNISDVDKEALRKSFFTRVKLLSDLVINDEKFASKEQRFAEFQQQGELVGKQRILYAINKVITSHELSVIKQELGEHTGLSLAESEDIVASWIKIFPEDNIVKNLVYESDKSADQIINVEDIMAVIKTAGDKLQEDFKQKIKMQCDADFAMNSKLLSEALSFLKQYVINQDEFKDLQHKWQNIENEPAADKVALVKEVQAHMKDKYKKEFAKNGKYQNIYSNVLAVLSKGGEVKAKNPQNFRANILLPVMVFIVAKEPKQPGVKVEKTAVPVPIIVNDKRFILSANTEDGVFDKNIKDASKAHFLRAQAAYAQNTSYTDLVGEEESEQFDKSTVTRWKGKVPQKPQYSHYNMADYKNMSAAELAIAKENTDLWKEISTDSERVLLEALSQPETVKKIVNHLVQKLKDRAESAESDINLVEGKKLKIYAVSLVMYSTNNVCEYCTKAISGQLKDWQQEEHRGIMGKLAAAINQEELIYCYEKSPAQENESGQDRVGLRANSLVITGQKYHADDHYNHVGLHPQSQSFQAENLRVKEISSQQSFVELVKPNYPVVSLENLGDYAAFISGKISDDFTKKVIKELEDDQLGVV